MEPEKSAIKTAALIAALAAAVFAVTACNTRNKNNGVDGQTAEIAALKTEIESMQSEIEAARGGNASASGLNGSWLYRVSGDIDEPGYFMLFNGSYEYYNAQARCFIEKGTYTVSGDIITFTQTHYFGGPFDLHKTSLYTKDEVKARYETSAELTDELFDEYFPDTFISYTAKYIPDADPDNDIWILEGGITYKRILASGQTSVADPRPPASAEFTITGTVLEKYNGNERFVIIPEGITEIGRWAFRENKTITNVVFPKTVTAIMAGAFLRCTSLTSVHIPDGVTLIGSGAFYECTSLARVTIPESVTQIDEFAFRDCTGIKRLEIPSGVTWIGNYVFGNWTSSQTIIIRGKGDEVEADAAWGPAQNGEYWWRGGCNAKIFYTS